MRTFLFIMCVLLAGCGSTLVGYKKLNRKQHEERQRTLLGKPIGKTYLVPMKSKSEKVTETMQKPAQWLLWIACPTMIMSLAMLVTMLFLAANPRPMKLIGTIAGFSGATSIICGAWIIASMWMLVAIPVLLLLIVIGYRMTREKKLKLV